MGRWLLTNIKSEISFTESPPRRDMRRHTHRERVGQKEERTGKVGRNKLEMWHRARHFRRVQRSCPGISYVTTTVVVGCLLFFLLHIHHCLLHPSFHRKRQEEERMSSV